MRFQPILFWLLMAVVALAPLPLGGNRPWAWAALSLAIGTLMLFWALGTTLKKYNAALSLSRMAPIAIPFLGVVIWIIVQASGLTPGHWHHPIWDAGGGGKITVNGHATGTALMRLLAYGGVFWLALNLGRAPHRAYRAFYIFAVASLIYAAYGLLVQFYGWNTILWFDKWAYRQDLTSTFVNRNNYATFAGLGLVVAVGLIFQEYRDVLGNRFDARKSLLFIFDSVTPRLGILFIAVTALVSAILLTHSRAGLMAGLSGLVVLCVTYAFTRIADTKRILVISSMVAGIGVAFFMLSGDAVSSRMTQIDGSLTDRLHMYHLVADKITERPWLGVGYGNYLDVSWTIRDASLAGYWDKAHNTYLETALELGIPAAALLMLAILIAAGICVYGALTRNREEIFPVIGVAATVIVGLHSLADFSLQIPAVAFAFAFILGTAYSQAWSSER
jgi:O-antigen ligase